MIDHYPMKGEMIELGKIDWMNEWIYRSLMVISLTNDYIGTETAKLNTSAQRCGQGILSGFEPTISQ